MISQVLAGLVVVGIGVGIFLTLGMYLLFRAVGMDTEPHDIDRMDPVVLTSRNNKEIVQYVDTSSSIRK